MKKHQYSLSSAIAYWASAATMVVLTGCSRPRTAGSAHAPQSASSMPAQTSVAESVQSSPGYTDQGLANGTVVHSGLANGTVVHSDYYELKDISSKKAGPPGYPYSFLTFTYGMHGEGWENGPKALVQDIGSQSPRVTFSRGNDNSHVTTCTFSDVTEGHEPAPCQVRVDEKEDSNSLEELRIQYVAESLLKNSLAERELCERTSLGFMDKNSYDPKGLCPKEPQ
jgi:hypothetical protein